MKIASVFYTKTFQVTQFHYDKIGCEVALNEKENPDEAFILAEKFIDNTAKRVYPHLFNDADLNNEWKQAASEVAQQVPIQPMEIGVTEERLRSCTHLQTLEIYFHIIDRLKDAEEKRKLWLVYDEMYAKLSNVTV